VILQTKSLFISAGHSDFDPGAVGNGHTEAYIVLEFRDMLADYLSDKLVFGSDGDVGQNLPLRQAAKLASRHDVAIELHLNAASPGASGVETLSKPEDYNLGRKLCMAIADTLAIPSRGAKPENSGQHSRLAFVSDGGGVIVELFFVTNKNDLAAYQRCKHELAEAVANVLIDEVCDEYEDL
jgi:N-acetylmuramoyl-L-alanine amidase